MYTRFAEVYDALMDDFDYEGWASYYLQLAERAGVKPKTLLECACGTGSVAIALAKMGYRVTGSDLSEQMLAEAQVKARKAGVSVPFVKQDMRELALHKPVDAVISVCDGVNYLLTDRDLMAFLGSAKQTLRPGGVLMFDVSTEHKLKAQAAQGLFFEDRDDLSYFWHNSREESTGYITMDLSFFMLRPDGLYTRFDEQQTQKAYTEHALASALKSAGFSDVYIYGDRNFDAPKEGEARIHITAISI